jgi:trehalose 6-phosphate synthase
MDVFPGRSPQNLRAAKAKQASVASKVGGRYKRPVAQLVRFIVVLVIGLALLAWMATQVVSRTTQAWFEKDITLRAQLAVKGARYALIGRWNEGAEAVREILSDITHDERILAAAACDAEFALVAGTSEYPPQFSCAELGPYVRKHSESGPPEWQAWGGSRPLPGGDVFVSAIPLVDQQNALGFVVLVHDLAFVERREARARWLILIAFGVLAVTACLATIIAGELFWRGWTAQMRQFLKGSGRQRMFQPILGDLRELVQRLSDERWSDAETGVWTPQRLKETLVQHLHGQRVVVVANREPYIHEHDNQGGIRLMHPASGLVTALEPVMRACSGVWIAHGSGSADRETVDARGHVAVPPGEESYVLRRVWLTAEEEKGYYYGFANEGLWPLCHVAHTRPAFRSEDWKHYQAVNERFAEAVASEADSDDPIVLVQDYHFALAPAMIRGRLPGATIITFWHIPWPNAERFGICPWRAELVQGLLGSSIMGFQTRSHCNNFIETVDRYLECRIDREQIAAIHRDRTTLVRDYPISIEWPSRWARSAPPVAECRTSVRSELGLPPEVLLGVGVDRLDYTKGIEERFWAVETLLDRFPKFRGRFVFVQLAAPSRSLIDRYRQLDQDVEKTAARINERFGEAGYRPVVLLRAHHEPPQVFRYYRAADVCYVSSLHDGMNLVAKEFVAARDDEQGVLVLSHFTGASRELSAALVVNPYDLDEAGAALAAALTMSPVEQRQRVRAMRAMIAEFNVYRWAGRMLIDASRLRAQDRLRGRLTDSRPVPAV